MGRIPAPYVRDAGVARETSRHWQTIQQPFERNPDGRTYQCKLCPEGRESRQAIELHLWVVHGVFSVVKLR